MTFEQIIALLKRGKVVRFNHYREVPAYEFLLSTFFVKRSRLHTEYTFNEAQASSARFDGEVLHMEDAQGFPCEFEFERVSRL